VSAATSRRAELPFGRALRATRSTGGQNGDVYGRGCGFQPRCRRAGVPIATVHTFEACACLLVALDVRPRVAMQILRHSRICGGDLTSTARLAGFRGGEWIVRSIAAVRRGLGVRF
jgi:hypothetical protein